MQAARRYGISSAKCALIHQASRLKPCMAGVRRFLCALSVRQSRSDSSESPGRCKPREAVFLFQRIRFTASRVRWLAAVGRVGRATWMESVVSGADASLYRGRARRVAEGVRLFSSLRCSAPLSSYKSTLFQ
ncbi:hypothetical protein ALP32_04400 [Pseudomonas avellanae]|uniref:Uncharacterized protein n=1 Tax=Pseudomonas avellanae TaxID=46257 RepID=A0A3M5TWI1_9PSED|nr:hypothetical protein ALP32_04400 [Pseudomonas avellanae]